MAAREGDDGLVLGERHEIRRLDVDEHPQLVGRVEIFLRRDERVEADEVEPKLLSPARHHPPVVAVARHVHRLWKVPMFRDAAQVDRLAVQEEPFADGGQPTQAKHLRMRFAGRSQRQPVTLRRLRGPELVSCRREDDVARCLAGRQHPFAIGDLVAVPVPPLCADRKRLHIRRSRHADIRNVARRVAHLETSVDSACRPVYGSRDKPRDLLPAVADVRDVCHGQHDLVFPGPEDAVWYLQLERRGKALAERDELPVDPCMDLVPDAVEEQQRRAGAHGDEGAAVEKASADVRQCRVLRPAEHREAEIDMLRIDLELVAHSRRAERGDHVLPIAWDGVSDLAPGERRHARIRPRLGAVGHLPRAGQRLRR